MVLQLPAAVRVFLCTRPTDMRKSFDGLSGLVQECFGQDLLAGHLFLNKRRDRIKLLYWEDGGMAIWYKRLEIGTFQQLDPQAHASRASGSAGIELTVTDLALLLTGIDLATARRKRYTRAD
jgi:transposase